MVAGAQDVRTGVVKGSCAVARNGILVVGVVGGGEAAVFVVDATVCTDLFFSFFCDSQSASPHENNKMAKSDP